MADKRKHSSSSPADTKLAWSMEELLLVGVVMAGVLFCVLGLLAWVAGGLAAFLANGMWPHLPVTRSPALMGDLVVHWDERKLAWPAEARATLGPDSLFWSLYLPMVLTVGALLVWAVRRAGRRRQGWRVGLRQAQRDNSPIWAKPADVASVVVKPDAELSGRVLLGEMWGQPKTMLATPRFTSVAVIAPTGSSKTVKYVVPTILRWQDAVLVTSTKSDVFDLTYQYRGETLGRPVYLFDPTGEWPEDMQKWRCAWSPLMEVHDYTDAEKVAEWLADSTGTMDDPDMRYYAALTKLLLSPMLWIARKQNKTMQDIADWLGFQNFEEIQRLFAEYENGGRSAEEKQDLHMARRALAATERRDKKTLGYLFATADFIMQPFLKAQMAPTTDIRFDRRGKPYSPFGFRVLDMHEVLDEGGTIYAVSDEEEQQMLLPVFQSMIQSFLRACRRYQRRQGTGPLLNPPLLLLEEAANVAPLPTLDKMAATYRGFGIVIMSIWQDEAQVGTLYDTRATTVLGNHTTRVYLPGSSDDQTLDRLSRLIGDQSMPVQRVAFAHQRGMVIQEGSEDVRLAPIDYLRTLPQEVAVALSGNLPPMRITATPWFKDPDMRARIGPEMCARYDRAFSGAKAGR